MTTKNMARKQVVLITGANAGIGLALAERLLDTKDSLQLILACRNQDRGQRAKQMLLQKHPDVSIDLVLLDTSSLASVYKAAAEIRTRYKRLDCLYFNAGNMPVSAVNWKAVQEGLFSTKVVHMFSTGEGLLKQIDGATEDGLKTVFATNLFGHFALFRELQDLMGKFGSPTQVIWTSSSNANEKDFSLDDFQHENGSEPYSSSKYASDLISVAINDKHNKQGIYSHTTCPGLVMTNLTFRILPIWLWTIMMPLLWFLRLFTQKMTITAHAAAEALIWLFNQAPQRMDPMMKYNSQAFVTGSLSVKPSKMNVESDTALELYEKLCLLEKTCKARLKPSEAVK